jgi:ketosteroid isomerase-like protein
VSENLDLVRSIYADWERGDFSTAEWADPEIQFVQADGLETGVVTGMADVLTLGRDFASAWEDWRLVAIDYRELDHDRILVLAQSVGRGKTSGLEMEHLGRVSHLWHIRDGKVVKAVAYFDRALALVDVGLEE